MSPSRATVDDALFWLAKLRHSSFDRVGLSPDIFFSYYGGRHRARPFWRADRRRVPLIEKKKVEILYFKVSSGDGSKKNPRFVKKTFIF